MKRTLAVLTGLLATVAVTGCGIGGQEDGDSAEESADVPFPTAGWSTDFSSHSVSLEEFVGGGPPKDGIPSIDEPKLVGVDEAPINDEIDGDPVVVFFDPDVASALDSPLISAARALNNADSPTGSSADAWSPRAEA